MNIKTIAEMRGVSVATISRVINNSGKVKDETRDKVIKAIEELDYVPNALARSLSRKESDVIGVVVPDISNSFYIELIKGVMEEANNNGLSIVFFNSDKSLEKELKAMKMLREQRIKGMLLISAVKKDEVDILRRNIKNMNIPLVLINKYIENLNYDGVFTDDIMASYLLTETLIKNGHTNLTSRDPPPDGHSHRAQPEQQSGADQRCHRNRCTVYTNDQSYIRIYFGKKYRKY